MIYILRFLAPLTDFIVYISSLIKEKIYIRIEKFVSWTILNFYFNFKQHGLLTAINKLLFDLHNILVPKSKIEVFSLLFFAYNFLPFCTDRACPCLPTVELVNINILNLLDMSYSIQDYLGLVILSYTIFIVILDLSILYISCNKEVKKFFPFLDFIINLALFLALVILVCIFLFMLFLLFDKTVEILIEFISEYIIKMLTSNPGPRGSSTGQPGGFGQPTGGGGKPPKKPGGYSPGKAHYKDKDDSSNENLSDEESKKLEAKRAKGRARSAKYRANKKLNETEEEKLSRKAKERAKSAKYRATRNLNETEEEKQSRLAKQREYYANYNRRSRKDLSQEEQETKRAKDRVASQPRRKSIKDLPFEEQEAIRARNRAKRRLRWFEKEKKDKSDDKEK